jgi:glycosyltransferase involved in cell wall biosynthesis
MISIIVPTRNRAYTLRKVLPSYCTQELVTEIVLVDDAGEDDTAEVAEAIAAEYPAITLRIVRHAQRMGAARSRQDGAAAAANAFVLFCDDDEYLEPGYAAECFALLMARNAGAVSGRRVYMRTGETRAQALARFGDGMRRTAPFNYAVCETVNGAVFTGAVSMPITNSNILTRREHVLTFGFDPHYSAGNGYREESDFQIRLFLAGLPVLASNDVHSFHLPMGEVRTGGQRIRRLRKFLWSVRYNGYFLDQHYRAYAERVGLRQPLWIARVRATGYLAWRNFLRPPLHALAMTARYGARG